MYNVYKVDRETGRQGCTTCFPVYLFLCLPVSLVYRLRILANLDNGLHNIIHLAWVGEQHTLADPDYFLAGLFGHWTGHDTTVLLVERRLFVKRLRVSSGTRHTFCS